MLKISKAAPREKKSNLHVRHEADQPGLDPDSTCLFWGLDAIDSLPRELIRHKSAILRTKEGEIFAF